MADEFLRIDNLNAWYGESHVLHGVNMTVGEGEVVSLGQLHHPREEFTEVTPFVPASRESTPEARSGS